MTHFSDTESPVEELETPGPGSEPALAAPRPDLENFFAAESNKEANGVVRTKGGLFAPGTSGGPGRPKGARNVLSEKFLQAALNVFEEGGEEALRKMMENDPAGFSRVLGSLTGKIESIRSREQIADALSERLPLIIDMSEPGSASQSVQRRPGERRFPFE